MAEEQVPVTVNIDRRLSDWMAYKADDKGMWAPGPTPDAALGELWRVWGAELGLPAIAPEDRVSDAVLGYVWRVWGTALELPAILYSSKPR